jgi:hypothetical protein
MSDLLAGMSAETDCRPCQGGYYCYAMGATDFDFSVNGTGTGICSAGYYCELGKYSVKRAAL